MDHTAYRNASGLPDPEQHTTARDIARMALALLQHFPREYRYFSVKEFDFRGATVVGHDHLLDWYPGADGIKTGFINASGYNLATSAVQNGHRLIGVVMGGRTVRSRDEEMAGMLDQGFAEVEGRNPAAPRPPAAAAAQPQQAAAQLQQAAAQSNSAQSNSAQSNSAQSNSAQSNVDETEPPAQPRGDVIGKLAAAAMHEPATADDDGRPTHELWGIQVGVFHEEAAAERAVQSAARLHLAQGKPQQILPPAKNARSGVYRARLLHFTSKTARAACIALHRKGIACEVVRPDAVKYASG
jgi:D-alanyl-D-alanine carboxypeptidase